MKKFLIYQVCIILFVALACVIVLPNNDIEVKKMDVLIGAIVTVAATLSGFTLTAVSIIISLSDKPLLQYLKKNNGMKELRGRYTISLVLGVVVIITCICVGALCPSDRVTSV